MPRHKLSDNQIAICIVPKRARWPENNTSATWTKAHNCVDSLQDLVRKVDLACAQAEEDPERSGGGIARRRAQICDEAMRKLANFAAFEIGEKALTKEIEALERLPARDAQQSQMHQKLTQALRDLREGPAATGRLLQERCKLRERVSA